MRCNRLLQQSIDRVQGVAQASNSATSVVMFVPVGGVPLTMLSANSAVWQEAS